MIACLICLFVVWLGVFASRKLIIIVCFFSTPRFLISFIITTSHVTPNAVNGIDHLNETYYNLSISSCQGSPIIEFFHMFANFSLYYHSVFCKVFSSPQQCRFNIFSLLFARKFIVVWKEQNNRWYSNIPKHQNHYHHLAVLLFTSLSLCLLRCSFVQQHNINRQRSIIIPHTALA